MEKISSYTYIKTKKPWVQDENNSFQIRYKTIRNELRKEGKACVWLVRVLKTFVNHRLTYSYVYKTLDIYALQRNNSYHCIVWYSFHTITTELSWGVTDGYYALETAFSALIARWFTLWIPRPSFLRIGNSLWKLYMTENNIFNVV